MADRRPAGETELTEAAVLISHRLYERLAETTRVIQDLLVGEYPELIGDAPLQQLLHETVVANVDTYFAAIRHHIPVESIEAPTVAVEHARRAAQRDLPLNTLVRAYRLAHSVALRLVLEEIRAAKLSPELGLDVFEQMSMVSFGYIDQISQQVVDAYQSERERWLENRNAVRASRIREILSGHDVDIDAMTATIRYPLRRIHIAVIVRCSDSDSADRLASAEQFVNDLAGAAGARDNPLFLPVDDVTGWGWLPIPADTAPQAVTRIREHAQQVGDPPWLAVGDPLPGIAGFRRSHRQALAAHTLALAAGAAARRVSTNADPGLAAAALLGHDVTAARAWVGEVLGPLAAAGDSDERLRETLRVFLRTGASYKAAGAELHFHVNTMKYRVQRAIERRGRTITADRLDVEIALLLCQWYGAAVLSPQDQ